MGIFNIWKRTRKKSYRALHTKCIKLLIDRIIRTKLNPEWTPLKWSLDTDVYRRRLTCCADDDVVEFAIPIHVQDVDTIGRHHLFMQTAYPVGSDHYRFCFHEFKDLVHDLWRVGTDQRKSIKLGMAWGQTNIACILENRQGLPTLPHGPGYDIGVINLCLGGPIKETCSNEYGRCLL